MNVDEAVTEVRLLRPTPLDRIMVTLDARVGGASAVRIGQHLRRIFPNNEVVVLNGDVRYELEEAWREEPEGLGVIGGDPLTRRLDLRYLPDGTLTTCVLSNRGDDGPGVGLRVRSARVFDDPTGMVPGLRIAQLEMWVADVCSRRVVTGDQFHVESPAA